MPQQIENILVASDSFKGSLSSMQVAQAVERGVWSVAPIIKVQKVYVADGGEGSVEAFVESVGGEYRAVEVHDPLMRPIVTRYGLIDGGRRAVIEMAAASGLTLLLPSEYSVLTATTYGVGEMILDALDIGCREFIICIGGSATNDGGVGMLRALGYRFLDFDGYELPHGGGSLRYISTIDCSGVDERLCDCTFHVACDVTNPFYGEQGAARIFAAQKGADVETIEQLDRGMRKFAEVVYATVGVDVQSIPGSGAAGGLGGGLVAFLNGRLRSGIDIILDVSNFDEMLASADLVITGEGRLDRQTLMGKAPKGVLDRAKIHSVDVVAIGGIVEGADELLRAGFAAICSINEPCADLELAMREDVAQANIEKTIARVILQRI